MEELRRMIQNRLMTDYDILIQENIDEEKIRYYIDQIVETLPNKEKDLLNEAQGLEGLARSKEEYQAYLFINFLRNAGAENVDLLPGTGLPVTGSSVMDVVRGSAVHVRS